MQDRLRSLVEYTKKEKAFKEVAKATMQEKNAALWVTKGRVKEHEGFYVLAEQRATDLGVKMGEMKLRLAEAESIISTRDKEVVDLKVALEESEDNFYDMGIVDANNSSEPIMFQSR
nr:hypothetical protein CFP56_45551 [Quercus suber]